MKEKKRKEENEKEMKTKRERKREKRREPKAKKGQKIAHLLLLGLFLAAFVIILAATVLLGRLVFLLALFVFRKVLLRLFLPNLLFLYESVVRRREVAS